MGESWEHMQKTQEKRGEDMASPSQLPSTSLERRRPAFPLLSTLTSESQVFHIMEFSEGGEAPALLPRGVWVPHPWRCSGPGWMGPWAA